MPNFSELTNNHDTSTQAMTEVALGLSMAFFALLILALISISLPANPNNLASDMAAQVKLAAQHSQPSVNDSTKTQQEKANPAEKPPFIVLYWAGQYVDVNQQKIDISDIQQQNVVIAVDPQIPFSQLVSIQGQFNGQEMRLTTLSDDWKIALLNDKQLN